MPRAGPVKPHLRPAEFGPAVTAAQERTQRPPARLVADGQAAGRRVRVPALGPVDQEREHREELQSLAGEPVLDPVGLGPALDEHPQFPEAAQPVARRQVR